MCEIDKRFKVQRLIKAIKEQNTLTLKLFAIFELGEMGEAQNNAFMNLTNLASRPPQPPLKPSPPANRQMQCPTFYAAQCKQPQILCTPPHSKTAVMLEGVNGGEPSSAESWGRYFSPMQCNDNIPVSTITLAPSHLWSSYSEDP